MSSLHVDKPAHAADLPANGIRAGKLASGILPGRLDNGRVEMYVQKMNVQKMNKGRPERSSDYRSYLLLDEISKGSSVSQRDLSKKLNIALGLVNTYIKNLVARGFIKIGEIPAKRYAYYLTPKGFSEKSRLAYQMLERYTHLYREARRDFLLLFSELRDKNVRRVAFAGLDELSEIAYLSLQELDLELVGVCDEEAGNRDFFSLPVRSFEGVLHLPYDAIVVTALGRGDELREKLVKLGVPPGKIYAVNRGDGEGAEEET